MAQEEYQRIYDRKKLEKAKKWKHTEKTNAYIYKSRKGDIDWWRYQQVILLLKLLPFAEECKVIWPDTIV